MITAQYSWIGSPAKDFTVKIYSPYDLSIIDGEGQANQMYADGQEPSEFQTHWEQGCQPRGVDGDGNAACTEVNYEDSSGDSNKGGIETAHRKINTTINPKHIDFIVKSIIVFVIIICCICIIVCCVTTLCKNRN